MKIYQLNNKIIKKHFRMLNMKILKYLNNMISLLMKIKLVQKYKKLTKKVNEIYRKYKIILKKYKIKVDKAAF